jgi:hypothetical protein
MALKEPSSCPAKVTFDCWRQPIPGELERVAEIVLFPANETETVLELMVNGV